ncbi:ABC transporter ATP-binding protein [Rheinheimera sp. MMS21-TC3]|uniref:ABC transporter ATP-binding protein n=1 Tax=Rheinheimera sp. MMS21-TC3 TaxID=3072790 RepID=UPI0028C42274|nr:ABC transporter ATP-binding protein [Rheinheimera sp. MMS21-TC3]WNO60981.1 ABC transporter ATP-binding protein [Rheinheimera sp. MMS21-TC3]
MLALQNVGLQLSGKTILNNINFRLKTSEFIGIIGPNGAGKSSLLRLVQRALLPRQGQIILKQQDLNSYSQIRLAQLIAVVAQNVSPVFALTSTEVASMGLLPYKSWYQTTTDQDRSNVSQALSTVGLASKAKQLVDTLSGGEQQRLYIAKALVQQPELLLLDEPTNHLDVLYQHQILQLISALNISVLACLHDLNLAALYCDKLLLLNQGQQVAFGSPEQVLQPDLLQQVFGLPCELYQHSKLAKPQVMFYPCQVSVAPGQQVL